jgi:hypothetical protein
MSPFISMAATTALIVVFASIIKSEDGKVRSIKASQVASNHGKVIW